MHRINTLFRTLLSLLLLSLWACATPAPQPVELPELSAPPRRLEMPLAAAPLPEPGLDISPEAEALRQAVADLILDPTYADTHVGVLLVDLDSDQTLVSLNAHQAVLPASNMKLYTTAAALAALGPDFRFSTRVEAQGQVQNGILLGDLVVMGSGDPAISGRFYGGNATYVFHRWAEELKRNGIYAVQGDLVGDESYMEPHPGLYPGWEMDDISYSYAAQTGALCLNDNCVDISLVPADSAGDPALIETDPPTCYVAVENNSTTSAARRPRERLEVERRPYENVIDITGGFSQRIREKLVTVTVDDPSGYFMTVLAETLAEAGIVLSGRILVRSNSGSVDGSESWPSVAEHRSPPLSELISVINKESVNLYAEQLLKTLGAETSGNGDREAGAEAVSQWIYSMGVDPGEFRMIDGSGLSRQNRLAPAATMTLLRYMHEHPRFPIFLSSLAIGGVDGTLDKRMQEAPLLGQVRAKSGYMRGVHTLAGYVPDADGDLLAFVIMLQGPLRGSDARALHDDILILAREFSSGLSLPVHSELDVPLGIDAPPMQ